MPSVTREKAPMTRKGNTPSDGKKTPETGKKNIMVGHPHETSKVMNAPPRRAERNGNTIKNRGSISFPATKRDSVGTRKRGPTPRSLLMKDVRKGTSAQVGRAHRLPLFLPFLREFSKFRALIRAPITPEMEANFILITLKIGEPLNKQTRPLTSQQKLEDAITKN